MNEPRRVVRCPHCYALLDAKDRATSQDYKPLALRDEKGEPCVDVGIASDPCEACYNRIHGKGKKRGPRKWD